MARRAAASQVIVAGAGVAGLAAAHRLLERGYDVTLIEADNFIGGKLGAHRDTIDKPADQPADEAAGASAGCDACADLGGCIRQGDWHEHCYHMYLNWYHNFWALMSEIGTLGNFLPVSSVANLQRDRPGTPPSRLINVGSPWTTLHNIACGIDTPVNMFLSGQTMADLTSEPAQRSDWLEKTSITSFMKSRSYASDEVLAGTNRTTAQAFASPSYLSSARSFKTLLSYGLRLPEPSMWLLAGPTASAIFAPWLQRLHHIARAFEVTGPLDPDPANPLRIAAGLPPSNGPGGRLTIRTLTSLVGLTLDAATGRIAALTLARNVTSPSVHRGAPPPPRVLERMAVEGDLILALPPRQLGSLITPEVARRAPSLPDVHYLRTEPMISLDLFFRRRLAGIPRGITVLLDSPYQMSFLDTSQTWTAEPADPGWTSLNVVASNADTLVHDTYPDAAIVAALLGELHRYLDFSDADLLPCRTHLQTNVGEELFVNQVGSWQWRPQATCGIPNLFLAGDFCQTMIDVVTIEGAVVSGLMAAEALRRRHRQGPPIRILQPDQFPALAKMALAAATRPYAYGASVVSAGDAALKRGYSHWFPNG